MKTLSQRAFLSAFVLMLVSLSLSLIALGAVVHQQKTKTLFDHFQDQINDFGALSPQKLNKFIKRSSRVDKQLTILSVALFISPAQAIGISLSDQEVFRDPKHGILLKRSDSIYLTQDHRFKKFQEILQAAPLSESFQVNKANSALINSISTEFFSPDGLIYELSLPFDQHSLSLEINTHLLFGSNYRRPRWIVRFSKSTVLDTLLVLSSEQSHILLIEALILILFSFYLIYQTLIFPLLKLSEFAKNLQHDENSLAPLEVASTELMLLQQSLINFHQALREEQRTLAMLYQKFVEHERKVTSKGLSARVMHEIGNPLASVMGLVDYLRDELDSKAQVELLDLAYAELDRIKQLSKQVLKSAKSNHSSSELEVLYKWALMMMKYHSEYSAIKLSFTGTKQARLAIPLEITQIVLMNLLVNAARAQLGQGMILTHGVINSSNNSQILRLYVLDQGKDVSDTMQSVLFEPWQSDDQEGNGLGLMIARSSLEQYNGSLDYIPKKDRLLYLDNDTVSVFSGACFCLSIPLLVDLES